MAGREVEKFLSPAHFQVIPSKTNANSRDCGEEIKLLPPGVYEKPRSKRIAKEQNESKQDLETAKDEIRRLRDEIQGLKEHFDTSKHQNLQPLDNGNKLSLKSGVKVVENFQKLDELEAENESLVSENRKQLSIINKLRSDIKQIKIDYMTETETLDGDLVTYTTTIRQLKQELKDKDKNYESEIESMKNMLKKESLIVKELKEELQKAHKQIKAERSNFEDVISQHATQKYQEVKNLQERFKTYREKLVSDVEVLQAGIKEKDGVIEILQNELNLKEKECEKILEDKELKEQEFKDKINQCRNEIESSQEKFESTSIELRFALEKTIQSHNASLEEFKDKMNTKEQQVLEQQSIIDQLRAYIGENLPNIQMEKLKNENDDLKNKLENLTKENGNITSTIQFMKIRLTSLNEILTLQECELKKSLLSGQDSSDNVLTMWRQKVFGLLVKLKSQEIVMANEQNQNKLLASSLQSECKKLQHDIDILSHTLADRNAELQIEVNKTQSLQKVLSEKDDKEKELQSTLAEYQLALSSLHNNSLHIVPFLNEVCSNMDEAFSRLGLLSQRVSFATGRVQFLEGLFAHKQAKWKNEVDSLKDNAGNVNKNEPLQASTCQELLDEIDRLTQEREMLANKAIKDAGLLESRVDTVRAEYDDRMKESSSKIDQLEMELRNERERSSAFKDKIQTLQAELNESNEALENLGMDLARHESNADIKLSAALSEKQASFTEEISNLEKQLNGVRGEHTKTVVALRQAEHLLNRERQKTKEQVELQQKEFEMKLEVLEKKIRKLDKERNMLMATIRQEGIKISRSRPKQNQPIGETDQSDSEDDEKENKVQSILTTNATQQKRDDIKNHKQQVTEYDGQDEESIANALQELKFLSEALLNMKDDHVDV